MLSWKKLGSYTQVFTINSKKCIKAYAVPTIFKRGTPETKKLSRETNIAAASQDTQDQGKSS